MTTDGSMRDGRCGVCGCAVRERAMHGIHLSWWSPVAHAAPCGAPCLGGGVRPKHSRELTDGVGPLDHAHQIYDCGARGCKGGVIVQVVPRG